MPIYQTERSVLTSIYNTIDTTIDNLATKFRNKTDDLIETMLNITISDLCSNTLKNYAYMQRLMRINSVEHQTTMNQLGSNAMPYGNSKLTNSTMQMPSYADDVNYYKNYVAVNTDTTREVEKKSSPTSYVKGELYQTTKRLFPDDLDALNGTYTNQRWNNLNEMGILAKTKRLFQMNKINTIISRFSTSTGGVIGVTDENDVASKYGMSHGRNLLREDCEKGNSAAKYNIHGYENPYCRVWTHHYQYDRLDKLIRPFVENDDVGDDSSIGRPVTKQIFHTWGEFSTTDKNGFGWKNGKGAEGWKYSVLNDNGFVNITPKYDKENKIHTKQCMFSIENLAWKGYSPYAFEKALSWEQRGPLGGRIMWFPPYGIQFNETTQANWTNHTFIGRGEDVYTYTNTVRTGNLSFMMVVDHPSIIDYVSWNGGNGVSDTDLLRFFAGCGYETVVNAAKPTPLTDERTQEMSTTYYTKPTAKAPDPVVDEDIPDEITHVTFYVFYPNNYSGVYDRMGNDHGVEAIAYLLRGSNAQKKNGNDDYKDDYPISLSNPETFTSSNGHGYEMGQGAVTDNKNSNTGPIYGSAMTWSSARRKGSKNYVEYKDRSGNKREWWYRIDGKYEIPSNSEQYKNTYDQRLIHPANYSDTSDNGLNIDADEVKKLFNNNDDTIYSLAEIVAGLTPDESVRNKLIELGVSEDRVNEVKNIFDTSDIVDVSGIGYSNSHGNNSSENVNDNRNNTLAIERVNTVIDWIRNCKSKYNTIKGNVNVESVQKDSNVEVTTQDVSYITSKKWRSAKITIEITKTSKGKLSDSSQTSEGENGETVQQGVQQYVGFEAKQLSSGLVLYTDKENRTWTEVIDPNDPHYGELVMIWGKEIIENGYKPSVIRSVEGEVDKNGNRTFNGENNTVRYDQEYHFFKTLKQENPIIFDKLMDKIQYFDPAFHSMTPEGFSGRLNFLHQCTRQGNTIGASDKEGSTASNLAFGRPPICVLRLGDFYNQMIVIDNISINFDNTWDLNIEGAGVIPMIANITISFKFIGGGDLAGPVRRLQNAMTFNYYANGRLYDNRADRVLYKSDGTSIEQGALDSNINTDKGSGTYFHMVEMYKGNHKDDYIKQNN